MMLGHAVTDTRQHGKVFALLDQLGDGGKLESSARLAVGTNTKAVLDLSSSRSAYSFRIRDLNVFHFTALSSAAIVNSLPAAWCAGRSGACFEETKFTPSSVKLRPTDNGSRRKSVCRFEL
jgi:hypothetical protein